MEGNLETDLVEQVEPVGLEGPSVVRLDVDVHCPDMASVLLLQPVNDRSFDGHRRHQKLDMF